MSKTKKETVFLKAAALCLTAVISLTACGEEKASDQPLLQSTLMASEQANYKTVQVTKGEYVKDTAGIAGIVYLLETSLFWEGGEASYEDALVRQGDRVEEGQVLMTFNVEGEQTELENLKLQLQRAKEDFEEENGERLKEITVAKNKTENLTGHDLQIANLSIEKLQAAYEGFVYQFEWNKANLEESIADMEKEIVDNSIRAPFDGVIDQVITFNEGDMVVQGQVMIRMYSTDKVLLRADDNSGKLRYNMDVTIETGSKDDPKFFTGKVIVAPNILPATLTQNLTIVELNEEVTEKDLLGSIKYHCTTEIIQDILVAEKGAVNREDGEYFVYVLNDDMVQKRYVKTGFENSEVVWILDGLSEGQTLIVD